MLIIKHYTQKKGKRKCEKRINRCLMKKIG